MQKRGKYEYTEYVGYADDFELFYKKYSDKRFTKSEIKLIYDAMDRKEYPATDGRYIDYKRILKEILKIRKPNQQLSQIRITRINESFPPHNFYEYLFI
jgi:hypothetical protein